MELHARYQAIVDGLPGTPQNEAQTRLWVIDVVLRDILGYSITEIVPEDVAVAGNRPDYTVLPDSPHRWLLEAKAWNVSLTEQHAIQATTYAYQSGSRWVVLTNGREWQLYDSHVTGSRSVERLAMSGGVRDPDGLETLLSALTRASVVEGKLDALARRAKLMKYVEAQLGDANSDVVRSIWSVARKQAGFEKASRSEIAEALLLCLGSAVSPAIRGSETCTSGEIVSDSDTSPVSGAFSLADSRMDVTGSRPAEAVMPDGRTMSVRTWKDLFVGCIEWLDSHGPRPIPVPWNTGPKSRRQWINHEPLWKDGTKMRAPHGLSLHSGSVFVETHASASYLISLLVRLCAEVGVDPAQIKVTVR